MLRATMPASAEETAALLGSVPVFEELADDDLRRVAEVTVPRRFGAGEVVFREGDDSNTCYVVRSATPARSASTRTGARSRWRRSAPATSSASWRCSTTSGARRPSRRSTRSRCSAILGPDMRRLMRAPPAHGGRARRSRSAAACGPPTSGSRASPSRPCRAAWQRDRPARRAGPAPRAPAAPTSDHRHAGRSREARRLLARVRVAGSWPCSSGQA